MWDATSGGNQLQNIVIAKTNSAENNRILSVNGMSFGFDGAGHLTSDGVHTYQYDAAGRLARVDAGTASEANYFYDATNRRVKKVVGGVTTVYIWEGSRVIAEYSTASPQASGGLRFYNADRLSTRVTTNNSGTVTGTQSHMPFGEDAGSVGEVEKRRFTNYERDENGSDYAVNRQYGNGTGRFLRPDPIAGSPATPQSLNRYSYSVNDPINLLDPTGLMGFDIDAWWNAFFNPAGLYLDGQRVPEGLDGLAWGLLRGGGGDIGPFWAWTNPRGEWVVDDRIVAKPTSMWLLPSSSGIIFLPNDRTVYNPIRWNSIIESIIVGFRDNSECWNSFYLVGINLTELLSNGIKIGPADLLLKSSAKGLGLTDEAFRQGRSLYQRTPGVFQSRPPAFTTTATTDGKPAIFLTGEAFAGGLFTSSLSYLKEVLAHELIHAGGYPGRSSRALIGGQDLDYMGVGFTNIIRTCAGR